MELTHLNASGEAHMADVGGKADTHRIARARAVVTMSDAAYDAIVTGNVAKGDVLSAARIAGIMAAKRTSDLIPLCHPIALSTVEVRCEPMRGRIEIETRVECVGKTGVEMEALTAASIAALTIYDMIKAIDRSAAVADVRLLFKSGGKSGEWRLETRD